MNLYNKHHFWVLHSCYPDGGWRGIEKCYNNNQTGTPLLFDSKQDAEQFMLSYGLICFAPYPIVLGSMEEAHLQGARLDGACLRGKTLFVGESFEKKRN